MEDSDFFEAQVAEDPSPNFFGPEARCRSVEEYFVYHRMIHVWLVDRPFEDFAIQTMSIQTFFSCAISVVRRCCNRGISQA